MRQTLAITLQNLRSIPGRIGPSLVAVIGVAGVVAVLVAVLSMARGFESALTTGTDPENVVIMRSGSSGELDSGFDGPTTRLITQAPQLAFASPELYVVVDLQKKSTGTQANVPFRGISEDGPAVRDEFEIVEGRLFERGRKELIAGVAAAEKFSGLEVGNTLQFGQERWDVVGLFSTGGGATESELWTDTAILQGAYRRGNSYSIVYGRLQNADDFQAFKDELTTDPRLSVKVERETEFRAQQSEALSGFISVLGYGIAILMALGALFGALNTMYTAVSDRSREIGTLRALGFASAPIVVSVMVEALLLALAGGVIGAAAAYALFNGFAVSTLNFSSFTQVVFAFAVTPDLLVQGVILALFIGLIGGLAPAVRAARMPIVSALRE
ncbi:MAG: FtsX-like permease family protein [Gammaproteobacteria bacterium]|jgi:putative ABC transport system permease protein|nr:FtsX-like permease family protein [Gammaproteobacteria bacterium]